MRIFLDTTSVCERKGPHVTGIQRAILGIWSGLVGQGSEVIPLRMDHRDGVWVPAQVCDLSASSIQLLPVGCVPDGPETRAAPASRWFGRLFPRVNPTRNLDPTPIQGDVFLIGAMGWMCRHGSRATKAVASVGAMIVPLIHDIYPIVHPEWVDPRFAVKYERWFASLLQQADRAFCVSQFTAREVGAYCRRSGVRQPPMTVIRLGDEHAVDFLRDTAQQEHLSGDRRPRLVYVSTVDPRKNHRLLVESWRLLAARRPGDCPDLTWVGDGSDYASTLWNEVQGDSIVSDRILWHRDVTDAQLATILDESVATLYPSRYEGWGLPVAESLARGRICLAARAASLPEICPGVTPLFDPDDPKELALLVERLLDDEEWTRELYERIRTKFRTTSWRESAMQILSAVGGAKAVAGVPAQG